MEQLKLLFALKAYAREVNEKLEHQCLIDLDSVSFLSLLGPSDVPTLLPCLLPGFRTCGQLCRLASRALQTRMWEVLPIRMVGFKSS